MKEKHLLGDDHPISIEEILDETNQLDIGGSTKTVNIRRNNSTGSLVFVHLIIFFYFQWLHTEALPNNPKIETSMDGRYLFKPTFKIKDGKNLLKLLKQHDLKGLGGVLLDDVQESLPHCEKVLKHRASDIIYITRPIDKKKILFYNDRTANFGVN